MAELTVDRPGFVYREVAVELSWVPDRAYGFSGVRIATIFEELVAAEELRSEAADDVIRAAGFSDQMIAAAARRSRAGMFYTFDRRAPQLRGAVIGDGCTFLAPEGNTHRGRDDLA